MGRRPCCTKEGLNRGAWSAREDKLLINYIKVHGEGKWRNLPQKAGLMRCGKSCRLRWLNYLRPDIKRGSISSEEEDLIIRLHNLLGNRWSLIAGRLPGRTDNEIKNYWNTNLGKRVGGNKDQSSESKKMECMARRNHPIKLNSTGATAEPHPVIRTKAVRCTKVVIPLVELDMQKLYIVSETPPSSASQQQDNSAPVDFDISELLVSDALSSGSRRSNDPIVGEDDCYGLKNLSYYPVPDSAHEPKFQDLMDGTVHENQWTGGDPFKEILDLAFFLSSENEWNN